MVANNTFWFGEDLGFGESQPDERLDREAWEPSDFYQWLELDSLGQILSDSQGDRYRIKESAKAAFDAWVRLSSVMRQQVWREREIAAELYELFLIRRWQEIPGFVAIGVGKRKVEGLYVQRFGLVDTDEEQLVGIITVDPLELPFPGKEKYAAYFFENFLRIPPYLKVPSKVKVRSSEFPDIVPLVIEESSTSTLKYNRVSSNSVVQSGGVQGHPILQSGSVIHCEDDNSTSVTTTSSATLTAIVVSRRNFSFDSPSYQGLTVAHVLNESHPMLFVDEEASAKVKVGQLYLPASNLKKSISTSLDAALAELHSTCSINPRLKWTDILPAPPIFPTSGLPVQMYGGKSKHQTGYIDQVNYFPVGGVIHGVVPHFTADIHAQPGDSGALLVSGHGSNHNIEDSYASTMSSEYLDNLICGMLGMLFAGSSSPKTRREVAYFRPVLEIFSELDVAPWVRPVGH